MFCAIFNFQTRSSTFDVFILLFLKLVVYTAIYGRASTWLFAVFSPVSCVFPPVSCVFSPVSCAFCFKAEPDFIHFNNKLLFCKTIQVGEKWT